MHMQTERIPFSQTQRSEMQAASSTRPLQLKGLFERVQECNTGQGRRSEFVPLNVGSAIGVGYVRPDIAQRLAERGKAFYQEGSTLRMADSLVDATPATRTDAVHSDLLALHADGLVPGWRNEMFPVVTHFNQDPLFSVERYVSFLFLTQNAASVVVHAALCLLPRLKRFSIFPAPGYYPSLFFSLSLFASNGMQSFGITFTYTASC